MKKEYDFSKAGTGPGRPSKREGTRTSHAAPGSVVPANLSKAQRGKFYRSGAELNIPVYLDRDVAEAVREQAHKDHSSIGAFVNAALRRGMRPARNKPRRGVAK